MYILGVSAFYHDSAAALIKDGKVVCAAEEERFSRIKHDNGFPYRAIEFCLKSSGVKIQEIEYIAYYEKPLLKFERIIEVFIKTFPWGIQSFINSIPEWLSVKIKVSYHIRKLGFTKKIFFVPHHASHAAAAFFPSPFKESAILTIDGIGEYETTALWKGAGKKIEKIKTIEFPHSIGLLYSAFTAFLGFRVNHDEYKVMGLSSYGNPKYLKEVSKLIDLKNDGSFKLNMPYFSFQYNKRMWSAKFEKLFGKPRNEKEEITDRIKNLASTIQKFTETALMSILRNLHQETRQENLCLGGGVALNAVANGKIYEETPFKHLYVFGPAGDNGSAIGAALFAYHQILDMGPRVHIRNLNFGSAYSSQEIENSLKINKLNYERLGKNELVEKISSDLASGKIIGLFQGNMEFGPRALGNRSIIANPKNREMKNAVNRIKVREQFRPFAGSIIQTELHNYFDAPPSESDFPFMNFCFKAKRETADKLQAIIHEDGTTRIQTVSQSDGIYYEIIRAFFSKTGIPCILNTSFNLKGKPIVENPDQAIKDFLQSDLDVLAIGEFIVYKKLSSDAA